MKKPSYGTLSVMAQNTGKKCGDGRRTIVVISVATSLESQPACTADSGTEPTLDNTALKSPWPSSHNKKYPGKPQIIDYFAAVVIKKNLSQS